MISYFLIISKKWLEIFLLNFFSLTLPNHHRFSTERKPKPLLIFAVTSSSVPLCNTKNNIFSLLSLSHVFWFGFSWRLFLIEPSRKLWFFFFFFGGFESAFRDIFSWYHLLTVITAWDVCGKPSRTKMYLSRGGPYLMCFCNPMIPN